MSSQATTAIPIRPAVSEKLSKANLASTPGGMNFYGSTPGGTRIFYSRDQLLSLASSPLSQSPRKLVASIPAEISRSPHMSYNFKGNLAKNASPAGATTPFSKSQLAQENKQEKSQDENDEQFEMDL